MSDRAGDGPRQRGMVGRGEELNHVAAADDEEEARGKEADLTGEWGNIVVLLILYTLQGIPMGIAQVVPMILKEGGATFSDLAMFALADSPFSVKLFWAPLVDAVYIRRIGRRKTWMVPAQLCIGFTLIVVSMLLDDLLYVPKPAIFELSCVFFLLYFLCATQDIAVDGWALTMLRPENASYAATCNAIGQTLGASLGVSGYLLLAQFKIMTLSSFMFACGMLFIIVTALVAVFKTEGIENEQPPPVIQTYKEIVAICSLRAVRTLSFVFLTWKAPFALLSSAAFLKMQEMGVSKESLSYTTTLVGPLYLLLPAVISPWTSGQAPLSPALTAYPWRCLFTGVTVVAVYATPSILAWSEQGMIFVLVVLTGVGAVLSQTMFVSQMALINKVSDPLLGGTYMTLLNTISNMGGLWPNPVSLKLIDLTSCLDAALCSSTRDGFYLVGLGSVVLGLLWHVTIGRTAERTQRLHLHEWRVKR